MYSANDNTNNNKIFCNGKTLKISYYLIISINLLNRHFKILMQEVSSRMLLLRNPPTFVREGVYLNFENNMGLVGRRQKK